MAITLITGVPGSGKTAHALDMMMTEAEGRPLMVDGIPELTLPHEPAPPLAEWTEQVDDAASESGKKLQFTFAPRTLVVIDEAQRIYRPRSAGSVVPPYVAAFETHRHLGIDFWLITQHHGLIDANIRKLVTRHIHIRVTALGRTRLEWQEVGDPDSKSSRDVAARSRYLLPKRVFGRYKSAELHTKVKRRLPTAAKVAVLAFVVLVGASWFGYRSITGKLAAQPAGAVPGSGVTGGTPGAPGTMMPKPVNYVQSFAPRVEGLPHTAPAYDKLTEAKRVPFPVACIESSTRCGCYTEQATRIDMSETMCRQIASEGLYRAFEPAGGMQVAPAPAIVHAGSTGAVGPSAPPVQLAQIPDTFNGTHVGTVESTRVVGRGPQSTTKPGVSVPASPQGATATGQSR
jgi:zona occludens toxin